MKRIQVLLFLLFALSPLFAQRTASNWGERILFGTSFTSTDSTKLILASVTDSILAGTTFSGVLYINDWSGGIWTIDMWLTNVGGTTDSIRIDYRRVTTIRDKNTNTNYVKFGAWRKLLSEQSSGSLLTLAVAQSDSSWWSSGNGRQFRIYDTSTSTDSTTQLVTDFLR